MNTGNPGSIYYMYRYDIHLVCVHRQQYYTSAHQTDHSSNFCSTCRIPWTDAARLNSQASTISHTINDNQKQHTYTPVYVLNQLRSVAYVRVRLSLLVDFFQRLRRKAKHMTCSHRPGGTPSRKRRKTTTTTTASSSSCSAVLLFSGVLLAYGCYVACSYIFAVDSLYRQKKRQSQQQEQHCFCSSTSINILVSLSFLSLSPAPCRQSASRDR